MIDADRASRSITLRAVIGGAAPDAGSHVRDYYDAYWSAEVQPRFELDEVLVELLERHVDRESRCLDVGCGAGETYAQWINREAASYVGVDVSAKAVEHARQRGLSAELIDEAVTLPFAADSFDVAVCIEVFEHLFAPARAASEIRRVLRPGGVLIASTPNSAYWRLRANLLFGVWNPLGDSRSIEAPWRDPHIRFFTVAVLERMLRTAGYGRVEVGAHGGRLLDHMTSRPTAFGVSGMYRRVERRFPALLGMTLHALAVK